MVKSKRERFIHTSELRMNAVIDDMRKLGKCSSTSYYEYTDADVRKIIKAIEAEVEALKAKFSGADRFTLGD